MVCVNKYNHGRFFVAWIEENEYILIHFPSANLSIEGNEEILSLMRCIVLEVC